MRGRAVHQQALRFSHSTPGPPRRPPRVAARQGEAREPSQLDLLLGRLPACVTKEAADELAVNFCYMQV